MVSFTGVALFSLAAIGSLAAPKGLWHHDSQCMSTADAQQVADNYAELIRHFTVEGADASLSPDFTDYSESVNTLINTCPQGSAAQTLPLLSPSFTSREQFETGQGQQPPINFKQLNIYHTCDAVIIRWETTNTAPIPTPRPVVGIIIMEVEKAPAGNQYPWIIKTVYSEFDAGAWLQNLEEFGICGTPNPSSPPIQASATPSAPVAPPSASASATSAPAASYTPVSSVSPYSASSSPSSYVAAAKRTLAPSLLSA